MRKLSSKNLISKDLDRLGIVAGICNEIGLIRCIDQIIPLKNYNSLYELIQNSRLLSLSMLLQKLHVVYSFFQ